MVDRALIRSFDSLYIGGDWVRSEITEVVNPSDGQILTTAPVGDASAAEAAVGAARHAFDHGPWPKLTQRERISIISRMIEEIDRRSAQFVATIVYNVGSIVRDARAGLFQLPMDIVRYMVEASGTLTPQSVPPLVTPTFGGNSLLGASVTVRDPVGVVAAISAYNGPFWMNVTKSLPAMVMGNTVVLKPSDYTPLDALMLAEIAHEIGLPPGVFNVITGGADVGKFLSEDPRVDLISFTGSDAVGSMIAAQAARTLKVVKLELGGKSALIVRADARLDEVLPVAAKHTFAYNSGQGCALLTRHLVHNSIRAEYVRRLAEMVKSLHIGPADDATVDVGPLIRQVAVQRSEKYVQAGIDSGARLIAGGKRPPDRAQGFYFEPTIFDNVDNASKLAQEEVFGPLLCVIGYDTDDEAISIANNSSYGLSGGIWSSNTGKAYEMAMRMRTGMVTINGGTGRFGPATPFGGVKRSGFGREWGMEGLLEFTAQKVISFHAG